MSRNNNFLLLSQSFLQNMKGNIYIYFVFNQRDFLLIHQHNRFEKHYCIMLTQ